jgi:hypothetical protein
MKPHQEPHLTPDEIELWAEGLLPTARALHLSTCDPCYKTAERERRFFLELANVARFAPTAQLAERVMARVKIEAPVEGMNGR